MEIIIMYDVFRVTKTIRYERVMVLAASANPVGFANTHEFRARVFP